VRIPPPLYFISGIAIGTLLNALMPIHWKLLRYHLLISGCFIAFGMMLASSAVYYFRLRRTPVLPHKSASALVIRGPYRFTRNPMYLALSLCYLGISILVHSFWSILLLPLVLLLIRWRVIAREERYLERRFGADYAAYRACVRRWI